MCGAAIMQLRKQKNSPAAVDSSLHPGQGINRNRVNVTSHSPIPRSINEIDDVMLVGNSHLSNINTTRLYPRLKCKKIIPEDKTIKGAINFVKRNDIQ